MKLMQIMVLNKLYCYAISLRLSDCTNSVLCTMLLSVLLSVVMAVIHLSETDNKIYGQEGMCVN